MSPSNFERMIQLAEDIFGAKSDPGQLDVDQEVMEHLQKIHPATVSAFDGDNGPVAWILLIPTTHTLMSKFLEKEISERQLYELTPLENSYDALYLCSALVLEEYRRKGIAKRLTLESIESIRRDHPLKALFVWAFTKEGELACETISRLTLLPLYKRM